MQRSLVSVVVGVSLMTALFATPAIARDPVAVDPMASFEPHAKLDKHRGGIHNVDKLQARRGTNALTGAKHWVLLRCQYQTQWGNKARVQDMTTTRLNSLFSSSSPGLSDFWAKTSYNNISITHAIPGGETEFRNMPQANSAYGTQANPDAPINITASYDTLHHDCASVWNDAVSFTSGNYYAIIIDQSVGACGVGGFFNGASLDGVSGLTGTLVGTCQDWMELWAHEMGHAYGLQHSAGATGVEYQNSYDALAAPCGDDGIYWNASGLDPRTQWRFSGHNCLPSNLLAVHKNQLGWFPASRIFRATGGSQTINLERTAAPVSGSNYLMAIIERDKNNYFTVEARFKTGISTTLQTDYDENIPSGAGSTADGNGNYRLPCCYEAGNTPAHAMIVITLVAYNDIFDTRQIMVQGNDDNNDGWYDDPGTQWTVGETWTYENLSVAVNSIGTTSFNVTITREPYNCSSAPFNDVPTNHPFCKEIQWMAHNQVSNGFGDGSYKPAEAVTRQAMSAFMARTAGATLPNCTAPPFPDVPTNHPFCKEIKWMKDNNISTGFQDGTYKPSDLVTRQAMSAFMARLAGNAQNLPQCQNPPFPDVPINHPFCKEIKWMKDTNISTGFQNGLYQPADVVTRQAMSAFLFRVSGLIAPPV